MISQPLPLADSLSEVADFTSALFGHELPGFQVSPDLCRSMSGRVIALVTAMEPVCANNGLPHVFDVFQSYSSINDIGPHIDSRVVGPAMHINRKGVGKVLLRSLTLEELPLVDGPNGTLVNPGTSELRGSGQWYEGEFEPGTVTIFFEGMRSKKRILPPALHEFRREGPGSFGRLASTYYHPLSIIGKRRRVKYQTLARTTAINYFNNQG